MKSTFKGHTVNYLHIQRPIVCVAESYSRRAMDNNDKWKRGRDWKTALHEYSTYLETVKKQLQGGLNEHRHHFIRMGASPESKEQLSLLLTNVLDVKAKHKNEILSYVEANWRNESETAKYDYFSKAQFEEEMQRLSIMDNVRLINCLDPNFSQKV